jgi:2-polyprenyl-6-methoxyphenol hydroxylase-like FAD-dependent oxidoreductase
MGLGGPVATSKLRNVTRQMPLPALIRGQNNSFALMPCSYTGDQVGIFATMEADDRSREEWAKFGADKQHLAKVFHDSHSKASEWPEIVKIAARAVEVDNMTLWPFYQVPVLGQWASQSGRVVLIGDTAHGIPPTGGQGAAMAFEDAATLADLIAKGQAGLKETLAAWESRRTERIEKVIGTHARQRAALSS